MRIKKNLHWLLYPLFVLACARQTTPTGGPKDSIPPKLVSSTPQQGQLNFKGSSIALNFSEAIILNNPREQIIVTPDVGKDLDVKAKKNQLILTFEKPLNDSTTYSVNFREAVQDITEKNPVKGLKLAFSTGSYIDSLSIKGHVYDLLKNNDIKEATVSLYASDTFDIFKHRPTYTTKSDENGIFALENLKPGRYFIYAADDKNKNLIVESKSESYGFLQDTISLSKNVDDIHIPLVRLDSRPLKLTSARAYSTYFNIKTTKSLQNFKISAEDQVILISSFGEDQANIRVFNTFPNKDSLLIRLTAKDSINNALDTTLFVKFLKREIKAEDFNMNINNMNVIASKGTLSGKIQFNKPIVSINYDSIFYQVDSVQSIYFAKENLTWDSLTNSLSIQKQFDKKLIAQDPNEGTKKNIKQLAKSTTQNRLYLGKAAFISVELDSSKRISQQYDPIKLEDSGVILVEVIIEEPYFFVQLLTKDFKVVDTKRNSKKFNFEDLKPGEYQLRLVIDHNNDGTWNPGNYYKRQEPEKIYFYKNEKLNPIVNLKANWELGPLLITK